MPLSVSQEELIKLNHCDGAVILNNCVIPSGKFNGLHIADIVFSDTIWAKPVADFVLQQMLALKQYQLYSQEYYDHRQQIFTQLAEKYPSEVTKPAEECRSPH